jgi:ABC-type multidrug transport system fused ATPase/permease subunit
MYWYPTDSKDNSTTYSVGFFKSIVTSGFFSVIFGVGFGGMYVSLWYGFKLVNDGEISLGDLTAFQSYIFQIGGSLGQISQQLSKLIESQGAAGRIFYLLERTPTIPHLFNCSSSDEDPKRNNDKSGDRADEEVPRTPMKPDSMEGAVDFNNVDFFYPARPDVNVLRNFSLSVPAHQTAALVGPSGAGKSTCIALLQRFYDVTSGSITVDGHDIRDLDLQWLRANMAYVQQEPQLFGLSIRENIVYGVEREVSQEELEEVARNANAHEFISQWPNGYDTMVGERGVQLSGGQKQRIAIARALVRKPRILLLDEATSALDAESEHLVQEAIDNAVVGRTVLIVAHRLSTIQRAQQIVVVDDHQIVDVGSHQVLLERCSKYQDLIKRQSFITAGINIPEDIAEEIDGK